jgi:hypothetical protein
MGAPLPKAEFQSPSARGLNPSTSAGTGKQANLNRNKPHSPLRHTAHFRPNSGADKTDIVRPLSLSPHFRTKRTDRTSLYGPAACCNPM